MAEEVRRRRATRPTVEQVEEGVRVSFHHEMPDPDRSFYADRVEVVDVPLGKRIVAVRNDPFTGAADVAIEFIMQAAEFSRLRESLRGIETSLRSAVPSDFALPPMNGSPRLLESFKAYCAYVATSDTGISIDFLSYPAIQFHRIQQGVSDLPQLAPIMRVEMLPGRLHALLREASAP